MTNHRFLKFRLIRRLDKEDIEEGKFDAKQYMQTIINILIQGGKIARAAGYEHPSQDPVRRANIDLLLSEIEQMLKYILDLIHQIRNLEDVEQ
jgi:hypothetical protein